jgi:hypothetical protein
MDIKRILAELHADRQNINQAIALEHVGAESGVGGHPWMSETVQRCRWQNEKGRRSERRIAPEIELSSPNRVSG